METTSITSHQKNVSTAIHLSTFSKWFIPFGNFILPLLLWTAQRRTSNFVDEHGRQAINFQISTFLYAFVICIVSLPFFIWQGLDLASQGGHFYINDSIHTNGDFALVGDLLITTIVTGTLLVGLFFFEIIATISAAVSASRGETYKFPLNISFIRPKEYHDKNPEEPVVETAI